MSYIFVVIHVRPATCGHGLLLTSTHDPWTESSTLMLLTPNHESFSYLSSLENMLVQRSVGV